MKIFKLNMQFNLNLFLTATNRIKDGDFPLLKRNQCYLQTDAEICAGYLTRESNLGVCNVSILY